MRLIHILPLFLLAAPASAQLLVVGASPERNTHRAALDATISVDFDRPVNLATLSFVNVYGNFSGPIDGTISLEAGGSRMLFDPLLNFHAGETITVNVPRRVRGQDGSSMRTEGHAFKFRAITAPASMQFVAEEEYSVRTNAGTGTRLYGVEAVDLNSDRRIDLATTNEISSDVRVLMNQPSGGNTFTPFLTPTNATDVAPSPTTTADFNDDGLIDLVTSNTGASTITLFFGNGDGTFGLGTNIWVGAGPYGVQALDVDGDGDADIAASARASSHIAILMNDGVGNFAPAVTFDGGGTREFGLCAEDMNNDGVLDLVLGLWTPPSVAVHLGNGDGSFAISDIESCGADAWQVHCGDVNGDGNMDVSTANASGDCSILFGDGFGGLTNVQTYDAGSFTTGTELGDLDGDGDLDWILSDFGSGLWSLLENDGTGSFSLLRTFVATANPSGTSMFDIEGDGDLDLILIDEISDLLRIEFNKAPAISFCFGDGNAAVACACGNESPLGAHRGCKNSEDRGALALSHGSTSVASNDLIMNLSDAAPGKAGLLVASLSNSAFTLGDGTLCLGSPQLRFPLQFTDGEGSLGRGDVAGYLNAAAGDRYFFQFVYRDTTGPCGNGFNTSNGLAVSFTP